MSKESGIMIKTALGLVSYSTGVQADQYRHRKKEQVKRQREYERKYYRRHKVK